MQVINRDIDEWLKLKKMLLFSLYIVLVVNQLPIGMVQYVVSSLLLIYIRANYTK